jgi:predicted secreted protein
MKRKKIFLIIAVFLAAVMVTGFVFADSIIPDKDPEIVDLENGEYEYTVSENVLKVWLKENPSTGFSWYYSFENSDNIELIDDEYYEDNNDQVGKAGIRELTFGINGEADGEIYLKYYRSFDPDNVDKQIIFTVKHGENGLEINAE